MASNHKHPRAPAARFLADEAATLALGAALAPGLHAGMVIFLSGELGAGKTTLARGILGACGVTGRVKSATFSLVEPYMVSKLYFYHFDFYRFNSSDEWIDSGLREYFNEASVCLVEWPEKAGGELPAPDLRIEMKVDGSGRNVTITAGTAAGAACLERLQPERHM